MNILVFDVEANGFLEDVTQVHCIVTQDAGGKQKFYFDNEGVVHRARDGTIREGIQALCNADAVVCHNVIDYDARVINKLYHINLADHTQLLDTLILSRLILPELPKHSLEAWATELKLSQGKVENEEWDVLTNNMLDRCGVDVYINGCVHDHLRKEPGEWAKAYQLEAAIATIHTKQIEHGVKFDVVEAQRLLKLFDERILELTQSITEKAKPRKIIPWKRVKDSWGELVNAPPTMDKVFKRDGKLCANVQKYFAGCELERGQVEAVDMASTVKGAFTKISWRKINLNSIKEVKEWLLEEGWRPSEYTIKGSPKLTEELVGLDDSSMGSLFKELNVLKHRRRFLLGKPSSQGITKGALTQVREDGRVPANAITLGTPTARYRHSGAVCNIPRPGTPYGKEIRSLFCVAPGHTLIGIDLSGIEARILAHYCYDYKGGPELANVIITGDFHQHNADLLGCTRNTAKSFLYAWLYGAGVKKLASVLGCSVGKAKKKITEFNKGNAPITALIADLERSLKVHPGWVVGLDGRRVRIREARKLLNSLLQGAAAIVFKAWMIRVDKYLEDKPADQVIAYHDELQIEVYSVSRVLAEEMVKDICDLAMETGEDLNIKVPIAAEGSVGMNWSDTH